MVHLDSTCGVNNGNANPSNLQPNGGSYASTSSTGFSGHPSQGSAVQGSARQLCTPVKSKESTTGNSVYASPGVTNKYASLNSNPNNLAQTHSNTSTSINSNTASRTPDSGQVTVTPGHLGTTVPTHDQNVYNYQNMHNNMPTQQQLQLHRAGFSAVGNPPDRTVTQQAQGSVKYPYNNTSNIITPTKVNRANVVSYNSNMMCAQRATVSSSSTNNPIANNMQLNYSPRYNQKTPPAVTTPNYHR